MTDIELLKQCLGAFEVLGKDAATCRKFLKKELGANSGWGAGNGQSMVASEMVTRLRQHLGME